MRTKKEIAECFDTTDGLSESSSFFLVGIGGAGMSGIARMLLNRGHRVAGTDSTDSHLLETLRAAGAGIHLGHTGEGLLAGDVLVLSDAIDLNSSPEVARATELKLPILRRSQVLGWMLRDKKVIAVTGTHGKTTTTAMTALALRSAGLRPTVVVGAEVPDLGSAIVEGDGDWAVVEACEAYNSFLDLQPQIVVLTNLELDHVDFHGSYESLLESVVSFVNKLPEDGVLVLAQEDPGCQDVATHTSKQTKPYTAATIGTSAHLSTPGEHNRLNAGGALTASVLAGANEELARQGIEGFHGAERRLQVIADKVFPRGHVTVVDDYAHHPTEIEASLKALKEAYPSRRLVVVFQPHLYSRTQGQHLAFAKALDHADFVYVTDIYPAREKPIPGVSSFLIAEALSKPFRYVPSRFLLPRQVAGDLKAGDVVVGMGAGNIADFGPGVILELEKDGVKNVAILYGGDSAEREVSIHSSLAVAAALESRYSVQRIDVSELLLSKGDLSILTGSNRPDVAILAVHGTHAEDGATQGLLELAGIPYSGSGILASAMAMNKAATKMVLASQGVPVAKGRVLHQGESQPEFEGPCVVKPNAQGSTVGLSFVESEDQLQHAIDRAFAFDTTVLIEEWVRGREVTVPVIGGKVYPVIEIDPTEGEYDFANKYVPGKTNKKCPAEFDDAMTRRLQDYALSAHKALGCRGVTRTDMIVDGDKVVVLEVNTLPGMTGTSLVAMSAKVAGLEFADLLEWMINDAVGRHEVTT